MIVNGEERINFKAIFHIKNKSKNIEQRIYKEHK